MPLQPVAVACAEPSEKPAPEAQAQKLGSAGEDGDKVVEIVDVSGNRAGDACTALVPFSKTSRGGAKAQVAALKRKFLDGMEEKSPAECRALLEERLQALQAKLEAAKTTEGQPSEELAAARREHTEAAERVVQAIQKELEAARLHRAIVQKKANSSKVIDEKKAGVVESETKLAMLEVYKTNQATMKLLREEREKAVLAAKEAKQNLLAVKLQEKKALQEAAKKASGAAEAPARKRCRAAADDATADAADGEAADAAADGAQTVAGAEKSDAQEDIAVDVVAGSGDVAQASAQA